MDTDTQPVCVHLSICGYSSKKNFVPTNISVTFGPGETVRQVAIQVVGDALPESDEQFSVRPIPTSSVIGVLFAPLVVTIREARVVAVRREADHSAVTIRTTSSQRYALESSPDFVTWSAVAGASNLAGTGGNLEVTYESRIDDGLTLVFRIEYSRAMLGTAKTNSQSPTARTEACKGIRNDILRCLGAAILGLLLTGCHSLNVSEPKRTAAEQLLLSTAADRGLQGVDLAPLRGKKVFLEEQYFKSYDQEYILGAIRELISTNGAFLVRKIDEAEIIVEARSGGLGIDSRTSLFGIPAIPVPVPFAGTLVTPEIALYKAELHDSTGKFALLAYDNTNGGHLHSTGSMAGKAYFNYYKLLGFFNWRSTDIPELDPRVFKRMKEAGK